MLPIRLIPAMLLALLALLACSTSPAPAPVPTVAARFHWRPGAPLVGAIDARFAPPDPAPGATDAAEPVTLHIACLAGAPTPGDSQSLAAEAQLVLRDDAVTPLGGIPTILTGLRLLMGPAAERYASTVTAAVDARTTRDSASIEPITADATTARVAGTAALPAGATAVVELRLQIDRPDNASRHLQVAIGRLRDDAAAVVIATTAAKGRTEQVLLSSPLSTDGAPLALHLPFGAGAALLLRLSSKVPSADQLAAANTAIEAASAAATVAPTRHRDLEQLTLDTEFDSFVELVGDRRRRPALLALARRFGALRCADLALIADDATLIALAALLPPDLANRDPEQTAMTLELASFRSIEPRLQQLGLPPQLLAWMRRHAGAAGRSRSMLDPLLRGCASTSQLDRRLIDANFAALDDGDPSSRVLASDWLATRGHVVAGYNPLGEPKARRRALAAIRNRRALGEQK